MFKSSLLVFSPAACRCGPLDSSKLDAHGKRRDGLGHVWAIENWKKWADCTCSALAWKVIFKGMRELFTFPTE